MEHPIRSSQQPAAVCSHVYLFGTKQFFIRQTESITKEQETVSKGTVIQFNYDKGYGFIDNDEGGVIYVHYSAIKGDDYNRLMEGQRVNFDVRKSKKYICATNVSAIH